MSSAAEAPSARMARLVRERPLCHPGVFALYARDYEYAPPPHLRQIYGQVFNGLERDGLKYLCHLKPREHGKSDAGTVDNASWRAMSDSSSRTLIISEGSTLAEKKLEQVRSIVERFGPEFGVTIKNSNNNELRLHNDANHGDATVEAVGFGSKVTGGHFDLIIFDDLVDWPSQRTAARRDKIWKQFQNLLNLGSEGETVYLVLGTRKHNEDLYSNLIANPTWYTVEDQAISDWSIVEDKAYDLITKNPETGETNRYSADRVHEIGRNEAILDAEPHYDVEVLWPERWPLNKLLVDMHAGFGQTQGNLVWKRENQNDAGALTGQVLGEDMLRFEDDMGSSSRLTWYAGLDPAVEADAEKAATNDTDYWALAVLAHDAANSLTYVVDVHRRRGMTMSRGIDWANRMIRDRDGLTQLLVEDQQAQRWFVQEASDRGMRVRGTSSSGDSKEDRILQMSSRFESGRVALYGEPGDWTSFVNEWAAFPTGDHDDRLDAVEIALRGIGNETKSGFGTHDISDLPM